MSKSIPPDPKARQIVKEKLLQTVSAWMTSRIEEVFEMADEEDLSPEIGPEITWRDLTELRWQICGCLATDLEHELGAQVEEIMREEFDSAPHS